MELILAHENADFDAVAAQLAAQKLHPEAVPLLSRRLNRNVSQFLALYWDALPFMRAEDWQRRRVSQIMLVDTQSLPSVRGMRRDVTVYLVDHHVDQQPDPAWQAVVEPVGATTTLLVEMLQAAGVTLTTEEATLLLLGIHEDTGSLLYDTTTARDAQAAAWLLAQGAQLSVVRRFLDVPLTDQQRELYQRFQAAMEWVEIEGQPIAFAAVQAPDDFDDEISAVAHRLREALTPAGLVLLVQLRHHVQMVARSTNDNVDVSALAQVFGGGGHSRAAAAFIETGLDEAAQQVRESLPDIVTPMAKVAEIMSYRVQTLPPTATVGQAAAQMQRFGYEGYPIVDPETERLVGLLTRRAVDRAMSHQLERLQVSQIMKAGEVMVRPSDAISTVQRLMIEEGWGQIPVVAEGHSSGELLGIVTRTDILNVLSQPARPGTDKADMRRLMAHSFSPALWGMVQVVGDMAAELEMPLYFVGGLVRDLLLGKRPTDVDMVVEGDAIKLASRLKEAYGGEIHTHARFGTAKWNLTPAIWERVKGRGSDRLEPVPAEAEQAPPETIDFVTARTEFYTQPSALPEVERGSIKLDLHRRDFTINTLAIRLDGAFLGQMLDFYGGQRDLKHGRIRVLHSLSFIDDPTRILRAVRLEQRLGFTIEPRTAELIGSALATLDRVTGDRIRHEIELALREDQPVLTLERLAELDVLRQIHPALTWDESMAEGFARLPDLLEDPLWTGLLQGESPAFLYFALWMRPIEARGEIMERLKVRKSTREDVTAVVQLYEQLCTLPADVPPSAVEQLLRPYRPRVLLAVRAAVAEGAAAKHLERYYREWRHVRTAVTGNDLRAMGLKPGPQYGVLLDRLLAARLDGEVTDEAGERRLLEQLLVENGVV